MSKHFNDDMTYPEIISDNKLKCPECKSFNIAQYRMLTGAIWCCTCGFRAEHKERDNPFKKESSNEIQ